jgi:hypothetical protein
MLSIYQIVENKKKTETFMKKKKGIAMVFHFLSVGFIKDDKIGCSLGVCWDFRFVIESKILVTTLQKFRY